ncbi:hypothetical protein NC651_025951 [Populus alba x Populus x berolinensis]|nr:hypothetical protein NC651_025951 [Populus alba x Populus x berolinensis]
MLNAIDYRLSFSNAIEYKKIGSRILSRGWGWTMDVEPSDFYSNLLGRAQHLSGALVIIDGEPSKAFVSVGRCNRACKVVPEITSFFRLGKEAFRFFGPMVKTRCVTPFQTSATSVAREIAKDLFWYRRLFFILSISFFC